MHKNKQKPKDGAPRPARASPKCIISPHNNEQASKSIENQMIAKNDDGIKRDDNQLELLASTRKNILLPSILKTERAKGRCTKINENRRTAHQDQRAQAQNASFSPLLTSTLANPLKINQFPPLATDTEARRTFKNAYLSMGSEGDRSPPVTAAAKKEAPSGTHGRGVVCEQGRTHKTIVRCYVFALESRPGSHA